MFERFPYGKAPFWLTAIALLSALLVLYTQERRAAARPDLVMATFAPNHIEAYKAAIPSFEREQDVSVSLQLVHSRALQTRLQNAMLAGTDVPDLVEMGPSDMSYFTAGPLEDIGFLDLTDRLESEGWRERLVESRLSLLTFQGRVFGLPHDVHPVALMYRADLVSKLGIDVSTLTTWDEFARVGREVTRDLDGDGIRDRYMIDLPTSAAWGIEIMMLQQGISLFDQKGNVNFNQPKTVDTILWYIEQTESEQRIAFECGWGTSLAKAMTDGLALFYIAPDWRTGTTQQEIQNLKGKMKVMPLPAWEKGGRRTSTWGGSAVLIPKQNPNTELAWKLAKHLYFDAEALGQRFLDTNIIPPLKDAWDLPAFKKPNPYFSGQAIGELFAELALEVPEDWATPYRQDTANKVGDVFLRGSAYFKKNGKSGLREYVAHELDEAQAYIEKKMARNVLAKR